jgi:glycosyltransferase involved in cell wall biosynthesis
MPSDEQNLGAVPFAPAAPLVDVLLITYNHEKYVGRAIESVLAQQTEFGYKLTIGDDCSTDNTQANIRDYADRYPDRINLVLDQQHRGLLHRDRVGIRTLLASKAKYVALLDGDDYWTDRSKLQKQVSFLEAHSDFAICYHNAEMFYENGSRETANLLPPEHPEVSSLEDLFLTNFIPTCSVVFRGGLLGELPDWLFTLRMADWPIHIMNAQYGKIRFINEVMASYCVHDQGAWSSQTKIDQGLEVIRLLDHVNVYLGLKYKEKIRAAKAHWFHELAEIAHQDGDRAKTRLFLRQYWRQNKLRDARKTMSLFFRAYTPPLYRGLRALRNLTVS